MSRNLYASIFSLSLIFYTSTVQAGNHWNKTKSSINSGSKNIVLGSKRTWDDTKQISYNLWQDTKEFSVDLWGTTKQSVHDATAPASNDLK